MKNTYSKLVLVSLLLVSLSGVATARECLECKKANAKNAAVQTKAAVCKRAQSTAELNVNNVRALINGYGNMWYDGSVAQYHLPKNSNTCPLFCAALWIGGTDVNDQLRLAALRFGSEGDDYWPGPLKINGTASIDLPVCNAYDKHWIITKSEVQELMSHFEYDDSLHTVTPRDNETFDIPDVIMNWPAKGDGDDLSSYLAPFYDADGDGEYNPSVGDYPYYDFDNDLCPRTIKAKLGRGQNYVSLPTMETDAGIVGVVDGDRIVSGGILSDQVLKGDQTIWWVFNDMGNTHTESDGQPIGLEIRAQAFAFSTNDEINNMTFYTYEIINRSTYELRETYFSQWVDPDLGYAFDDYVGCDVRRGLGYCYNGDEADGPGSGSYSGIPPAVGIDFFQGPYMDPDGKDNPKIDIAYCVNSSNPQLKQLISKYQLSDGSYDTIAITDDADLFYNIDFNSWYFVQGDAVGNCAINGVNFGNNIVDDERFGMRRFVFYNNSLANNGEPEKASDYYNYLRGYWKDNQRMKFGGDGYQTGTSTIECDFMFPDDSDPWHWGTDGVVPDVNPDDWTEVTAGNSPYDRRFMQSAGPFTLKPGAVNYITVGIPFAQASSGNALSSVELLREIDDVCQALFDNCFKVLDGPDAPTITVQELENEVILYLDYYEKTSNNYKEKYSEIDPGIVKSYQDENGNTQYYSDDERSYKFEGYQIYQLVDANASIADIGDVTKARLVAQCDIENYYDGIASIDSAWATIDETGDTIWVKTKPTNASDIVATRLDTVQNINATLPIGTLINYETNSATGLLTGKVMVTGSNTGIKHVFRITTDQFATGTNTKLVNNKEYYFIAIAYAQNRFKEYSQTEATYLDGQKEPYLAGRKNEQGSTITPVTAIPHSPYSENGGQLAQSEFGMCPTITRIEGYGNGGSVLRLTEASIESLMGAYGQPAQGPGNLTNSYYEDYDVSRMRNACMIAHPEYEENYGPLNVRVIDPLKLKAGTYNIGFYNRKGTIVHDNAATNRYEDVTSKTRWYMVPVDGSSDTVWSDFSISRYNEQIFIDLGIAVTLVNPSPAATAFNTNRVNKYASFAGPIYGNISNSGALLGSEMVFADNNKQWLSGIPDNDSYMTYNWIRSGTQYSANSYRTFRGQTTPYSLTDAYLDEDYLRCYLASVSMSADALPDSVSAVDNNQQYEGVVGGLWSPYGLVSTLPFHPGFNYSYFMAPDTTIERLYAAGEAAMSRNQLERALMLATYNRSLNFNDLSKLPSVRIVFTADTSKWTRCPVLEMCDDYTQSEGNARKFSYRNHASVDKLGRTCTDLGVAPSSTDPNNPAYIDSIGMGWFPGYAINVTTGERLNIMFGEDSRYVQYNGRDMMWNPVSAMMDGTQNYIMGGRHFIYVMNANDQPFFSLRSTAMSPQPTSYRTPSYDAGVWCMRMLHSIERMMKADVNTGAKALYNGIVGEENTSIIPVRDSLALLYASVAWVNMPLVNSRYAFDTPLDIPCDVTINIDIRQPYARYMGPNKTQTYTGCGITQINQNMPLYQFTIKSSDAVLTGLATQDNAEKDYIDSILNRINVVPNPYYSYSNYETASQLETKVRIVNLPTGVETEDGVKKLAGCVINIYTVDGTLVRSLGPTPENVTYYDWDLHNHTGLPIAGGMYLIHVKVPGIGERVIKWFGTMRPVDLNSFQF